MRIVKRYWLRKPPCGILSHCPPACKSKWRQIGGIIVDIDEEVVITVSVGVVETNLHGYSRKCKRLFADIRRIDTNKIANM